MTDWATEWAGFFTGCHDALTHVLDAAGCREGWLQGEAFRHFRKTLQLPFYCNEAPVAGGKADFSSYSTDRRNAQLLFLAECKVLGVDYLFKNVTGRAADVGALLAENVDADAPILFQNDERTRGFWHERTSSILSDYFRLVSAPYLTRRTHRFLFLVLDKRRIWNDAGRVLARVQFEGPPSLRVERNGVEVRGWTITGASGG